jgi:UDP-N-acetylglucosamine:LPS N-acetylglucosamine transferase
LFDDYRTKHSDNLYAKVDNFKTDLYMLEQLKDKYKLFFWSRDKGTGFFKRIKNARKDVFASWQVHNQLVEILWKNNTQGIIYTGDITYIKELTVNK